MKTSIRILVACALLLGDASRAFATFSIVAFDEATGDIGVAVASRVFGAGNNVPWAEAHVGAVATQAIINVGYGRRGLELLRQGLTAEQVLKRLLDEDSFERKEGRQVAIVDAKGNIAVHTGPAASDWKGHVQRRHFSVQGNILVGPQVLDAMVRAFERAEGDLAERLYAALKAGDDAGGDSRGRQSATIKVVRRGGGVNINNDRFAEVHVQDHPQPLTELRRLLNLQLATTYGGERARQVAAGDVKKALAAAEREATYNPSSANVALGLLRYLNGDKTGAVEALRRGRQLAQDFEARWAAAVQIPIFKRVLEDPQFMADVMR